ncbi:MAG: biotin--[acetyl-CoA-carboxylase] ligase [Pseudomonadota bacterium]
MTASRDGATWSTLTSGEAVLHLEEAGSTNDEAMALARAGTMPVWVRADRQVAGRGRRARHWVSETGNLYASRGFTAALSADAFGLLPLTAALALGDAIGGVADVAISQKWPNDVLIDGRKVSGILLEAELGGAHPGADPSAAPLRRIVMGFGVNVAHHPDDLPATHLAAHDPTITAGTVFEALAAALPRRLAALAGPDGVTQIRRDWLDCAVGLGETIVVRFDGHEKEGCFKDLDPSGRLILEETGGALTTIAAGDVFVRATETL